MSKSAADDFLSQAYDCWRGWDEASRRSFINILYMHARAPAYQWHWESFLIDYMVLDALYRLAHAIHGVSARIHGARIEALCTFYGLWYDPVVAGEIVSLRNELFHEALWSGDSPGSSFDEQVYDRTQCLRDLNQRLIPAMLGFQGAYTRSAWINWLSAHAFE
jgi:hypothetical protein